MGFPLVHSILAITMYTVITVIDMISIIIISTVITTITLITASARTLSLTCAGQIPSFLQRDPCDDGPCGPGVYREGYTIPTPFNPVG